MLVNDYFDRWDFVYDQRSGLFYLCDSEDVRTAVARGYSGKGVAQNEPSLETRVAEGPIPRGVWKLSVGVSHARLGPLSIPLAPFGHDAHNRSGFFIHGDNARRDGSASSGCIILDRRAREFIDFAVRRLGVRALTVE